MKKIIAVICALLLGCSAATLAGCKKEDVLKVYTNAAFPPFEYFEGKSIVGVDMDIMNEVGKALNKKVEFTHIDFDTALLAVDQGKCDATAAGVTITDARKAIYDMSMEYYLSVQYVISKVGDTTDYSKLESLTGKKIGVQRGTTGHILMDDSIEAGALTGVTVTPYKDAPTASEVVKKGDLDVVIIDKLPAELIVGKTDSGLKCVQLVDAEPESYGIVVKKGNAELLAVINTVIARMKAEGKIEASVLKHSAAF